jgi:hypothetical protein
MLTQDVSDCIHVETTFLLSFFEGTQECLERIVRLLTICGSMKPLDSVGQEDVLDVCEYDLGCLLV